MLFIFVCFCILICVVFVRLGWIVSSWVRLVGIVCLLGMGLVAFVVLSVVTNIFVLMVIFVSCLMWDWLFWLINVG